MLPRHQVEPYSWQFGMLRSHRKAAVSQCETADRVRVWDPLNMESRPSPAGADNQKLAVTETNATRGSA
ncbi:hypothetical protein Cmtc_49300 [Cupriavidus sp. TKC]|nr:hypothetical protein Cmtc_49300 [Cupriavidus sp. TKC]